MAERTAEEILSNEADQNVFWNTLYQMKLKWLFAELDLDTEHYSLIR